MCNISRKGYTISRRGDNTIENYIKHDPDQPPVYIVYKFKVTVQFNCLWLLLCYARKMTVEQI